MTQNSTLTRHPEGSLRELWTLSLPLMISSFASLFMIFTDRIFLARYSLSALNACVNSGNLAWAIMVVIGMSTAMSEVFVAQYNGAKKYDQLGVPVWQMIWFASVSLLFFIPLGIWGGALIFGAGEETQQEVVYFRWLMYFAPSYALLTALAGFFIGQGKTALMIWLAIFGTLINIFADWLFIFGVPGWIPEMGIKGAAIATCMGYFFESAVLGLVFLRRSNREKFGTGNWHFNWPEMKKCFRVGIPQGIFCGLEVLGWFFFYWMMTSLSDTHITVSSICQSFTVLLSFFCDGVSRGAAAVAGNLIGARKHELISRVLKSGTLLLLLFSLVTSVFLVIDPQDTVRLLFFESFDTAAASQLDPSLSSALKTCMICAFVYMFFEGFRWVVSGILVAAGDTIFLLIAGSLSVWVCLLLPIYLIVVRNHLSVEIAWIVTVIYSALLLLVYWFRFKQGAWKEIDLVSEDPFVPEAEG
jgi:MATE family multidrug resistance protein